MHQTLFLGRSDLLLEILNLLVCLLLQVLERLAKLIFFVLHLLLEFLHGLN